MWTQNKRAPTPHSRVPNTELGNLSNKGRRWFSSTGNEFICKVRKALLYRSRKWVIDPRGDAFSGTAEVTVPSLYNHLQLPLLRAGTRKGWLSAAGPGHIGVAWITHTLMQQSLPCAPGTVPGVRDTLVNTIDQPQPLRVYTEWGGRGVNSKHEVRE